MTNEEMKQDFLARIKSEGRSSPTGKRWNDFYSLLKHCQKFGDTRTPPVPLILAASGESNLSKHRRLSDQLDWAIVNSCFGEAVAFLENLGEDEWNVGSLDEWNADSYWKP